MDKIVECVANFSDGQSAKYAEQLKLAVTGSESAFLHLESNRQAGRSVITFAGSPDGVLVSALKLAELLFSKIDMSKQSGEHPRIGALDVCPFVPLYNSTIEECDLIARRFGKEIAGKYNLPVYLYRDSAKTPARKLLANIRKGGYENLANKLELEEWKPDFGSSSFNSKLGATVVGARPILLAWNFSIEGVSVSRCKYIAKVIREKFDSVRAIGWFEDFSETSPIECMHLIHKSLENDRVESIHSEVIGLIPARAIALNLVEGGELDNEACSLITKNAEVLKIQRFDLAMLIEKQLTGLLGKSGQLL